MQKKLKENKVPRFCVFCGIALPVGKNVTRCPGCAENIPEQFQPMPQIQKFYVPVANIDKSMVYCIYCGEFIDKTSKRTGMCARCNKELPRAPSTEP